MKISELRTGTKLELELYDEKTDERLKRVSSKIQSFRGESLLIDAPNSGVVIYPVHVGAKLYVFFNIKNDNQNDIYGFKAKVTGREFSGNLTLLQIVAESKIHMVQRRQFYRLICSLPLKYRQVENIDPGDAAENVFISTFSKDISGGGLCAYAEEKVDIGKMLEFELQLKENKLIKFYGNVVRSEKNEIESKFKYIIGITFKKIEHIDRENIISYIFEQQRKLRKRGLI